MVDLLNDPRFPDRPSHPDFWRIANVVLQKDGAIGEGGRSIQDVTAELVDVASADYAALVRSEEAIRKTGLLDKIRQYRNNPGMQFEILVGALGGAWLDAFTTGVAFQQAGGHQEE